MNDVVDFWAVDNRKMTVILLSVFDDILIARELNPVIYQIHIEFIGALPLSQMPMFSIFGQISSLKLTREWIENCLYIL